MGLLFVIILAAHLVVHNQECFSLFLAVLCKTKRHCNSRGRFTTACDFKRLREICRVDCPLGNDDVCSVLSNCCSRLRGALITF